MNLRDIYGDEIADRVLALLLTTPSNPNAPVRLIVRTSDHPRNAIDCCIVGAANLIAADSLGRPTESIDPLPPGIANAKADARYALNRPLTDEEITELARAMGDWDANDHSRTSLIKVLTTHLPPNDKEE